MRAVEVAVAQSQQRSAVGVVHSHNFPPEGYSCLNDALTDLARPQ